MEKEEDILSYEGIFSMEICNYSSYVSNRLEYNGALYNKMLYNKQRVFCHGSDDNHNSHPIDAPLNDSFGAFTMIMPENFSYKSIIDAMESGEMYSSMGPLFKEVYMEGNKIHIECSNVSNIVVHTGSKAPKKISDGFSDSLTSADFEIDDRAIFVRVSISDKNGRFADTRGFFRDELEF